MSETMDVVEIRRRLEKAGTLHVFHWCIIALSLLLTIFAWYFSQKQVDEKIQSQFNREVQQVTELVLERMQHYEDALWAGVAMLHAYGGDTDHQTWRTYVKNLHLLEKYPGINGLGVIHEVKPNRLKSYLAEQRKQRPHYKIHPPHQQRVYLPISYIIPVKGNEKAVGLDMAHEINRFTAARKAEETGLAQITGPITLVQDKAKTPGFLFYAPVYRGGSYDSIQLRRQHFTSLVYAPFIVKKLMSGVLSQQNRQVSIKIADGNHVLYNELLKSNSHFDANAAYKLTEKIEVYGRTWTFTFWSDRDFMVANANNQPLTILFGGIIIDALLLILFMTISRGSKRALRYADELTLNLREKTRKLEETNSELNKFAYVTSHDLRAPLRGIEHLVEWIAEDDIDNLSAQSKEHFQKLKARVSRMNGLIDGILTYSRVGSVNAEKINVDLNIMIQDYMDSLGVLPEVVLSIPEPLPIIYANETIIEQVFSNLINNAIKYNNKEKTQIEITFQQDNRCYEFSIADNGPGIKPEFQEKVFDLFQTLQPKSEINSSGVGLALVKKCIQTAGGTIEVSSNGEQGARFTFTWLKED